MKRFHADVSARQSAFQKRPEIFHAVSVYAAIYVLNGMVDDLVLIFALQSLVTSEFIGVKHGSRFNVGLDDSVQGILMTVGNDLGANLPAAFSIPMTMILSSVFRPCPVMRRAFTLLCMFRAFPPMKVSSASTSPESFDPRVSSCMVRRIRCSMNQADF